MEKVKRMAVSLPSGLLDEFDSAIRRKAYDNRSKAVADVLRGYLSELEIAGGKGKAVGTITLVYDHHTRGTVEKLTNVQHAFGGLIASNVHVHINHRMCLEVIVVKGNVRRIEMLADSLISTRGVTYGKLVCTSLK